MNKSKRMQIKAILCIVGVVILIVLVIAGILKKKTPGGEPHVPVVRQLQNVWIVEVTESGLKLFDGSIQEYGWADPQAPLADRSAREQIADVVLTDDQVTQIHIKDGEKISGKVLGVMSGSGVELEGRGFLEYAPEVKIYRLYNSLELAGESNIRIGYNFCDYVLEDGKVCAVLITREEAMEYIRVQIKASDYASSAHETVKLTADTEFVVRFGPEGNMIEEIHQAQDVVEITKDSSYFTGDRIYIVPAALTGKVSLLSVSRNQGIPGYRGSIEIVRREKDGEDALYVVNEVLLEEYLYAVVPSEMPSSYPQEALKAQAICARTYAYGHMLQPSNRAIGAHVDDSAGYQVYNNILEQDSTTTAVKETSGQLLYAGGALVDTYYYSTSCGFGSDAKIWKGGSGENPPYLQAKRLGTSQDGTYTKESMMQEEIFADFISQTFTEDFEVKEGWYRWTYTVKEIDRERMLSTLQSRYKANKKLVLTQNKAGEFVSEPIEKLGEIKEISIVKRNEGGVADEMLIETKDAVIKVITEHNIRYVLCDGVTRIHRQDGSDVEMATLLPSAFFVIEAVKDGENVAGYILTGGGFGHGVGMSQNGARSMANLNYTAQEILQFFYQDGYIETIY